MCGHLQGSVFGGEGICIFLGVLGECICAGGECVDKLGMGGLGVWL